MSKKKTENVRKPTKFMGVYQLESTQKRYDGKADLCFYITYKLPSGKKVWEKIGWRSEKVTAALLTTSGLTGCSNCALARRRCPFKSAKNPE